MIDRWTIGLAGALAALSLAAAVAFVNDDGSATATAAAAGRDLFLAKGCAGCHMGPDSTAATAIGPDLSRLAATEAFARRGITDPAADVAPGYQRSGYGSMPQLGLAAGEVDALVDYLLADR